MRNDAWDSLRTQMMMMVMTVLDLNSRSKRERLTRVVGVASDARVMGIPFCNSGKVRTKGLALVKH
jgi:hypothetical protein